MCVLTAHHVIPSPSVQLLCPPSPCLLQEARAQGLSDDSPFMKKALEAQERINAVLVIQAEVAKALESDSLRVMKKVLDKAEDAELGSSSLVKKLRARLREMEKARAKAALADDDAGGDEGVPSLDDEEMKRLREEKMRKASHPKYAFVKYPKIRTPDDFARGVLLNKKKVKQVRSATTRTHTHTHMRRQWQAVAQRNVMFTRRSSFTMALLC